MAEEFVIGVDVGTGGVRAVAADAAGRVLASSETPLPPSTSPAQGWVEQRPEDWYSGMSTALRALAERLAAEGFRMEDARGICVDSTSGTVLPVDPDGRPRRNALMYNDARATKEAEELNAIGADLTRTMGYRFNSSYGLAKVLWLLRHEPQTCQESAFLSAADFLAAQLTGRPSVTEYANALKMGYDLIEEKWPHWLAGLGVPPNSLPEVVPTGARIGVVCAAAARATGLAEGTPVLAGPTDGVAAFYASGAATPGERATVLGTTLVTKSVSSRIVLDPKGRIYCHRHADGWWLPGGASNVGCEYATKFFPGADLDALGRHAADLLPCPVLLYPLARTGERFPVVQPEATRFITATPRSDAEHFAAYLQAIAFVERWAYETVAELGGEADGRVFSSGGGSRNAEWMQLRADVLGQEVTLTEAPDSAFGSAVLAAASTLFAGIGEATAKMIRRVRRFEPRCDRKSAYDELYRRFRDECAVRGLA